MRGESDFVLPIWPDEAIWIGVIGPAANLTITAIDDTGARTPLTGNARAGLLAFPGLPVAGGYAAIDRAAAARLEIAHPDTTTRIALLAPDDFAAATGGEPPPPIAPGAAYRGVRLP